MAGSASYPPQPTDDDPTMGAGSGMPADPGDSQVPDQDDGSYCIEIRVGADKQITVSVERGSEEDAEESGAGGAGGEAGPDDDSEGTPVKSIKEGLTLALEIFRNDGQMPAQADDDFQQGFEGATK